jgi:lysophospholipase L1-like esterase
MKRLVCFGNSITASGALSKGWATRLRTSLDATYPGQWEVMVRGVIGETSAQARSRFDREVIPFLPALVLCQFGLNDSNVLPGTDAPRISLEEFGANLRFFIEEISRHGGTPVLLANHPVEDRGAFPQGNERPLPENHAPYHAAILEIGRVTGTMVIDIAASFQLNGAKDYLSADGVHLSLAGHLAYARAITLAGVLPLSEL